MRTAAGDRGAPAIARRARMAYVTASVHRRSDYHFELPPAQIAQQPAARRDGARLLWLPADGPAEGVERTIVELPALLPADAVVIVNDTRVIPARVRCSKATGGAVELLFLEPAAVEPAAVEPAAPAPAPAPGPSTSPSTATSTSRWRCWARARRPLRAGQLVHTATGATLTLASDRADDGSILVDVPGDGLAFLDAHGELPLPPYLEREGGLTDDDRERYQTVYAREPGAIAAPTAGLHLTPALLAALAERGATVASITLHVGLGTFAPVREDELDRHVMHVERFTIPPATAALVASGRPVVAIGTTVVRALESAATGDHAVAAGPGSTALFIRPGTGFRFRVVDHLLTNFHLPESTLLMLVCTFAGSARVLAAYHHAVAAGFRFFSYGDAMLCSRSETTSAARPAAGTGRA
jgi:S-adenosylmethionine:tRNA ribosyltransferase-isomerase